MLIVNFFSLNFTSIEIEGERVSSSQNEGTLVVVGGGELKTNKGKQREREGSKLGNLEQTYLLNVPLYHTTTNLYT